MTHPFLMVWLLLMIRYEFVYVYFIATKNVGDYSYMSSPNIYYRAKYVTPRYYSRGVNLHTHYVLFFILNSRFHESFEQWMGIVWTGFQFGVELYTHEPRMICYFNAFY